MAAYLCLIALIFVVINLVVDLLYFAVDPRLRVERTGRRTLIVELSHLETLHEKTRLRWLVAASLALRRRLGRRP